VSAAILPAWGFRRGIVTSGAESVVWLTDRAVGELVAVAALVVADVPVLCSIHAFGQAPARSRGIPFRHYPALVQVSCCSTLIFVVRVRQRGRCQRHRHQCAGEYYPSSEQARGGVIDISFISPWIDLQFRYMISTEHVNSRLRKIVKHFVAFERSETKRFDRRPLAYSFRFTKRGLVAP